MKITMINSSLKGLKQIIKWVAIVKKRYALNKKLHGAQRGRFGSPIRYGMFFLRDYFIRHALKCEVKVVS